MIPTAEAGYETGMRRFVGPQIYERNSFRWADLDITASGRAVRRRAEEMRDDEQVAEACRQLGDPMRRIIDEFFWHWPGYDAHNRAVAAHAKALADPPDEVDWAGVRLCWHEAAGDEAGWDYLRDRILRLDEPEIRPDFVDQLRRLLPALLVSVNAALFARAVEGGDDSAAADQLRAIMRMAFGDERLAGAEIAIAIRPMLDDLRQRAAAAQDQVTADPRRGLVVAQQLIGQADRLSRVIGDAPGRAPVATLCDEIAAAARVCIAAYGNETGEFSSCARLLVRARALTGNVVAVRDIDGDRAASLNNELVAICRRLHACVGIQPDYELRDIATLVNSAEDVLRLLAAIPDMPPEAFRKSCDAAAVSIAFAVGLRLKTLCDSRVAAALLVRAEVFAGTDSTRLLIAAARMAATIGHEVRQLCWFCGRPSAPESTARVRLLEKRTLTERTVVDIERCSSCRQEWNRLSPILGALVLIGLTMLLVLVIVLPLLGLLGEVGWGLYLPALGVYVVVYAGIRIAWRRARPITLRMREHPAVASELADGRVWATMDTRK